MVLNLVKQFRLIISLLNSKSCIHCVVNAAEINLTCSISVGIWSATAVSKPTTTKDSDKEQKTATGRRETYDRLSYTLDCICVDNV